ncbi:MAG TPA: hypothetical protein VM784_09660 [Actinomycetota bacterium]|nr:hypothetical protein [Actinomycetota bacterium]
MTPSQIKPGDFATLGVVFIEERGGLALVRLPNGSKTTVEFGVLRPLGGPVHFVQDLGGPDETAYCQACDWVHHAAKRFQAEDAYITHFFAEHAEGSD